MAPGLTQLEITVDGRAVNYTRASPDAARDRAVPRGRVQQGQEGDGLLRRRPQGRLHVHQRHQDARARQGRRHSAFLSIFQ